MGAVIGRVCNRIAGGRFNLNDKAYQLDINNGPNCLHSGFDGYQDRFFTVTEKPDELQFELVSPDGDQGFPGEVRLKAAYRLLEDGFAFDYEAAADQDTFVNITNHAYFNLGGLACDSILTHVLQSPADTFLGTDDTGLACGPLRSVAGTPYDFTEPHALGERIQADNEQIRCANGYDNPFFVPGTGLRPFLECSFDGLRMTILSDLPGYQLYTGNFLGGNDRWGKQGRTFPARSGVCFETQYSPDAMNRTDVCVPLLRAEKTMKHTTEYHFAYREE
ncbi:MAG: galactose mutarotase, partial [Solobacterium sp.]|nr:galactose mutarotase [Solobacterium sp.]